MEKSFYLETTVVSYYTNWPSRDLVVAARQQITREWWQEHSSKAEVYVSALVVDEVRSGDPEAAKLRLEAIAGFTVLELSDEARLLARSLVEKGAIPQEYYEDALHIAIAAANGIRFLLTWNCRHINNPGLRSEIEGVIERFGYECPVICTPGEFIGD